MNNAISIGRKTPILPLITANIMTVKVNVRNGDEVNNLVKKGLIITSHSLLDDISYIPIVYTPDMYVLSEKLHDSGFRTRGRGGLGLI